MAINVCRDLKEGIVWWWCVGDSAFISCCSSFLIIAFTTVAEHLFYKNCKKAAVSTAMNLSSSAMLDKFVEMPFVF
jgi:hypothetical protein